MDKIKVYEIDGPESAYFEICEFPDGSGQRIRITYQVIAFVGSEKDCKELWDRVYNLIRSELQDLTEHSAGVFPIIWWRARPVGAKDGDYYKIRARLATTPPLPNAFWQRWETKEGMMAMPVKDHI